MNYRVKIIEDDLRLIKTKHTFSLYPFVFFAQMKMIDVLCGDRIYNRNIKKLEHRAYFDFIHPILGYEIQSYGNVLWSDKLDPKQDVVKIAIKENKDMYIVRRNLYKIKDSELVEFGLWTHSYINKEDLKFLLTCAAKNRIMGISPKYRENL